MRNLPAELPRERLIISDDQKGSAGVVVAGEPVVDGTPGAEATFLGANGKAKRVWRDDHKRRYDPYADGSPRVGGALRGRGPGGVTPQEERYVSLRIRGFSPIRCAELMDQEDNITRAKRQRYIIAQRLEKTVGAMAQGHVPIEEMDDAEFDRYEDHLLQRIAMYPKESASFALAALKSMREKRKARRIQSDESLAAWVHETGEEVCRLAGIEAWTRRHAQRGSQDASHRGLGQPLSRGKAGGDNPSLEATLGALVELEADEGRVMKVLRETVTRVRRVHGTIRTQPSAV